MSYGHTKLVLDLGSRLIVKGIGGINNYNLVSTLVTINFIQKL